MESLKPQLEGTVTPVQPGQTEQASGLLRAKLTGKATTSGTTPSAGGMAESQAQMATKQAGRQQQFQGRLQGQQLEQQETTQQQQFEEQELNIMDKFEEVQESAKREADKILQEFARGGRQLDDQKAGMRAEQAGFLVRLQNKEYVANLQQEGQKARLENDIEFKTKATEQAFADEQALMRDQYTAKKIANMNQREWDRELAGMDINYILGAHSAQMAADSQQQVFTSAGNLASAGTEAYTTYKENPPPKDTPAPTKAEGS